MKFPTRLTHRFDEALTFATHLHAGQVRKVSGGPYVAHLLSVAALVLEDRGSEEEAIAALLHDAIEDQGGEKTRQKIESLFGPRVSEIVVGCSDAWGSPKPPWRERKQAFIDSLETASPGVIRVSAADKLDNVRSLLLFYPQMGEKIWDRFKGGKQGSLWYYQTVTQALKLRNVSGLMDELEQTVARLLAMAGE